MLTSEHYDMALDMWGGKVRAGSESCCLPSHSASAFLLLPQHHPLVNAFHPFPFNSNSTPAGCILAEMLNKLRGKVTRYIPEQQIYIYAIFPADHHLDHLQTIMKILGPPSTDVLRATTDVRVQNLVQRQVRRQRARASRHSPSQPTPALLAYGPTLPLSAIQIASLQGQTTTLRQYMEDVDEQAVKLLEHLLEFDPRRRIDARMALVSRMPPPLFPLVKISLLFLFTC